MTHDQGKVLVIGYGNPGRLDDGLGPALAEAVEKLHLPGVTVEADYQLTVEDAAAVARHEVVIFADADACGGEPFSFQPVAGKADVGFSTHGLEPEGVMGLAAELFGASARGYVLGIRGYEFDEFGEVLSPRGQANLAQAVRFIQTVLRDRNFSEAAARIGRVPTGRGEAQSCKTEST